LWRVAIFTGEFHTFLFATKTEVDKDCKSMGVSGLFLERAFKRGFIQMDQMVCEAFKR
jgi:hypothetical protein